MRVETQTLTEDIDTRALDYILHVDESGLKRDGNEWLVSRSKLGDIQKEAKKVFRDVKNGRLTVTYQRKVHRGEHFGREYAIGTSLQKLRRELREALSTSYVDIDAVNCQPTMLWDMLKSDRYPHLREYVVNPKKMRQKVQDVYGVTKDAAKHIFTSCMFSEDPHENRLQRWKRTHGIEATTLDAELVGYIKNMYDARGEILKKLNG